MNFLKWRGCSIVNILWCTMFVCGLFSVIHAAKKCSYDPIDLWDINNFRCLREEMILNETELAFGSQMKLNAKELKANEYLMKIKEFDLKKGLEDEEIFVAANHIFKSVDTIKNSKLYQWLRRMPKGGVLHTHDTALVNKGFLLNLTKTNIENLWVCWDKKTFEMSLTRYCINKPNYNPFNYPCKWEKMSVVRQILGASADERIMEHLTLYPQTDYLDINEVWKKFMAIFILIDGMITYKENWGNYFYNSMQEYHEDGVQYLELRSTLPILYDLEGNAYTEVDTVKVYTETLHRFMKNYKDFIGAKLIYAPLRSVDNKKFMKYVDVYKKIKKAFPKFVIGFDLVGQEDLGRPLKYFAKDLLNMGDVNFFFHAGETNWFGTDTDENLIDAVALGAKRIGHGYALVKHPAVMKAVKERGIGIEVNPISNQVLELVADLRNHPVAQLFAEDYPVVISSDDPSFWKTTPLTHDFYVAFLGISSAKSDLRFLKQLAVNSFIYSGMDEQEKMEAESKWTPKWEKFIAEMSKA